MLKVLFWDGNGHYLFTKRIDRGGFVWPRLYETGNTMTLSPAQLAMLIEGIDETSACLSAGGPGQGCVIFKGMAMPSRWELQRLRKRIFEIVKAVGVANHSEVLSGCKRW